ncbi:MAG: hypothetical protein ACOYKZ_07165 [Chlamydiia bacterium]
MPKGISTCSLRKRAAESPDATEEPPPAFSEVLALPFAAENSRWLRHALNDLFQELFAHIRQHLTAQRSLFGRMTGSFVAEGFLGKRTEYLDAAFACLTGMRDEEREGHNFLFINGRAGTPIPFRELG